MNTPSPSDNRERILLAAHQEFLNCGFRASMEQVAARAGVAKQTLYNHFPNKQSLFAEVIRTKLSPLLVALEGDPREPRKTLAQFGLAYRSCALSSEALGKMRNIVCEGSRFPELCQSLYAEGSAETQNRLAQFLAACMQTGSLRADDAQFAAEMLLGMLLGIDRVRQLYGLHVERDEPTYVSSILDCFLRAYAPALSPLE